MCNQRTYRFCNCTLYTLVLTGIYRQVLANWYLVHMKKRNDPYKITSIFEWQICNIMHTIRIYANQTKYQTIWKQFIVAHPSWLRKAPKRARYGSQMIAQPALEFFCPWYGEESAFLRIGGRSHLLGQSTIQGTVCNLYMSLIAVYLSHNGRVASIQEQTLEDLQSVLSDVPPHDCICLLGDFNEQLEANVKGMTGVWTGEGPFRRMPTRLWLSWVSDLLTWYIAVCSHLIVFWLFDKLFWNLFSHFSTQIINIKTCISEDLLMLKKICINNSYLIYLYNKYMLYCILLLL